MLRRRCTATAALESCPDFFHGRRSAFFAAHVPTHTLRLSLFVCVCLLRRNTAGHFDQRAERRSAAPHFIRAVLQRHAGALQANVCCTTSGLPSRLNASRCCKFFSLASMQRSAARLIPDFVTQSANTQTMRTDNGRRRRAAWTCPS